MIERLKAKIMLLVFLLGFSAAHSFASGKQIWAIDLKSRGFGYSSNVRIWFWHHYLVVEPNADFCRARILEDAGLPKDSVIAGYSGSPLTKTMVFDVDAQHEVSPDVLADVDREATCPQYQGGWWSLKQLSYETAAAWRKMMVRRQGGELQLRRPGQPPVVICSQCPEHSTVRWVSPNLLFLARFDSNERPLSAEVVDLTGKTRYQISHGKLSPRAYVVFNNTGSRFALLWTWQTRWRHLVDGFGDYLASTETLDRKTMKVFSSTDGQEIFAKTWGWDEASGEYEGRQADLRVALSDDGNLLAYCDHDRHLVIYELQRRKVKFSK
jgi:hypothetical protein